MCNRAYLAASEHDVVGHIQLKEVLALAQVLTISHDLSDTHLAFHLTVVECIQHQVCRLHLQDTDWLLSKPSLSGEL